MCNFEQPAFSCSHDCIECSATVYNVQRATCTSNILQWSFVSKIIENMAKTRCQVEYSMDASVSWRNPTIDICFIIHGENESSFPVATKFSTKQPVQANVSPFSHKVCANFTQIIALSPLSVVGASSICQCCKATRKRYIKCWTQSMVKIKCCVNWIFQWLQSISGEFFVQQNVGICSNRFCCYWV